MAKKFYKSSNDRWIFGVCGGLGEYFDIDTTLARILFVALTIMTSGFGVLVYIVLAIFVPNSNKEMAVKTEKVISEEKKRKRESIISEAIFIFAVVLIVTGLIWLISNFISWLNVARFWPLVLIVIGLTMALSSLDRE